MTFLVPLTIAALLAAALVAFLPAAGAHRTAGAAAIWLTGIAALIALLGLVVVIVTAGDVPAAALILLVTGLTAVVQTYAARSLRGDPRSRRFFALSALAAAGSTASVAADDVVLLAAGWTLATLSTIALVRTGGRSAQTRAATRRAGVALLLGDAALWAAVVVVVSETGSTSLATLGALSGVPALVVGILVATAAIARAGSFPFSGWLPTTVATTTPVSALLHAGFVNAGAMLLLRFSPVPSAIAPWMLGVAGGITMLAATVAMLTRPDVKGRLVQSTAAQMGFMLLACALGAYGVALVHVLGHALFKATLFLGAGSAVEEALASRTTVQPPRSRLGAVVGGVLVAAAAAATAVGVGALAHPSAVLLLFVVATAAVAGASIGAGALRVPVRAATIAGLMAAAAAYVAVVFRGAEVLVPVVPASSLPPVFAVVVFLIAGALALVATASGRIADRLFAFGFAWGRPPLPSAARPARASHRSSTSAIAGGPLEYGRL